VTDRSRRRLGPDLTPLRTSRDFRLLFFGGSVSGFGSFITCVTIPFQVAPVRSRRSGTQEGRGGSVGRTLLPGRVISYAGCFSAI
jgi:hypothetical protein